MTTLLLFMLVMLMGGFGICRFYRTSTIIFIFSAIVFIWIGGGFLPNIGLRNLQTDFTSLKPIVWKETNAIILLGAGTVTIPFKNSISPSIIAYSRIYEAVNLYRDCKSASHRGCTVIVSGGDPQKNGAGEADVYGSALLNLGVKQSDIELETHSLNTYQNAEFTSVLLKSHPFEQNILVTSAIHLRRASLYFAHFGILTIPAPADYLSSFITYLPVGYNFAVADFALHEYMGIARFHIYQILGLNHPASAAGVV